MSRIEKVFPTVEELSLVSSQVRCSEENCSAIFKSTSNLNMHLVRHHKVSGEELRRKDAKRQFYCPAKLCIYNKDSLKFFSKLKYVKQHFLKVHAEKNFVCNKCSKKFATETFQKMHSRTCGSLFRCSCGFAYNSMEALLTHCKRKGHVGLKAGKSEKTSDGKEVSDIGENVMPKKPERLICPKLSKDISCPIHHIAAVALSELSTPCKLSRVVDKGIQTESNVSSLWKSSRRNSIHVKSQAKQNSSQETQTTGKSKNTKINTETQTNTDYLKSKGKSTSKISFLKRRKKSMETQTKELSNSVFNSNIKTPESGKIFCRQLCEDPNKNAKYFNSEMLEVENLFQEDSSGFLKEGNSLNDEHNSCVQLTVLNTMSTKSFINSDELFNKRTNINPSPEISRKQDLFNTSTEINNSSNVYEANLNELNMSCKKMSDSENPYLMEGGSYNVFDINKLCNIETQTEIDNFLTECNNESSFTLCSTTETQTIDFDPLLYSNMCTQTSDEVNQLFSFNFVDIETQTAWPDL